MDELSLEEAPYRLGRALRLLRERKGLTQEEAMSQLNISQAFLSQIETGDRQPSFYLLCKMARLYEVTLATLFKKANL